MAAEGAVAIFRAAMRGDAKGVARMLDEDSRLLSSRWGLGETLLMEAAFWGHVGVVRLLLERGAEVDARNDHGSTALHFAAEGGHEEVVSMLVSNGADPSSKGFGGHTVLIRASRLNNAAVVRLLLRSLGGRGLDERDEDGYTALLYACLRGYAEVVRALLLAGADHTIATNDGRTPQQVAQERGHHQCVAVIQWWESELQRGFVLPKARTLHDDAATRQHSPATPVPAYLRPRVQGGKRLPRVQLGSKGVSGGPRTRGAAKRGAEEGVQEKEEEVCAMVGFVVKDLDGHLYTELMQGLRLR